MFAVLWLSDFRLQAALRLHDELPGRAIALVEDRSGKGFILETNATAGKAGVTADMPGVQALARCPELELWPRRFEQERIAQAALLEVAGSLAPEVEATADGCCTVDLRTAKITDWRAWSASIVARLAALALRVQIGIAPNPDLAFLAARRAHPLLVVEKPEAFLSGLAISELAPPPELLAVLRDWGIRTLGELTNLPHGELASRLGPGADRLWQRAAGRTQRLLRLVRPVDEFVEAFDFEREIDTTEPLLFILRKFLDQLTRRLDGTHRVAAKMTLTLPLENDTTHERLFEIPSPTADAGVLFRILDTHLENLQLPQRPTGVRLRIEASRPEHQQFRLFENPLRDPNRFGETLARLASLVGTENVGVAEIADTHRPDCFRLAVPAFHELRETEEVREDFSLGLPLRRFRPPVPAQVEMERHQPAAVVSEKARGRVTAALGPYRASGGWWERAWSGEEWDVEISSGDLFRLRQNADGWWVEGCYDAGLR